MDPQISVVIITLNEENYLPLLLEDLARQTDTDFEVIISDGGSIDKTEEKALSFKDRLRISFIKSPKAQASFQRNLGAKNAKGDYFFFLDADTRIKKTYVIERLKKHIKTDPQMLYLPIIKPGKNTFRNRLLFGFSVNSVKLLQKLHKPMSIGPLIVMHRSLFDKIKGYDEKMRMAEDHNIVIRAYKEGYAGKFLDDVPVIFSMRRFDKKGSWKMLKDYAKYTFITLVKGGVYDKNLDYAMGGQEFDKKTDKK